MGRHVASHSKPFEEMIGRAKSLNEGRIQYWSVARRCARHIIAVAGVCSEGKTQQHVTHSFSFVFSSLLRIVWRRIKNEFHIKLKVFKHSTRYITGQEYTTIFAMGWKQHPKVHASHRFLFTDAIGSSPRYQACKLITPHKLMAKLVETSTALLNARLEIAVLGNIRPQVVVTMCMKGAYQAPP